METDRLRVLVSGPMGESLGRLLADDANIEVVATPLTPVDTVEAAISLHPDVVLADIDVTQPIAVTTLQILDRIHPRPAVIILSPEMPHPLDRLLSEAGSDACFDLSGDLDALPASIRNLTEQEPLPSRNTDSPLSPPPRTTMKSTIVTTIIATSLALASTASAATITYQNGFTIPATTALAQGTGGLLQTYSDSDSQSTSILLNKFDASLGTLNSVTFNLSFTQSSTDATFDVGALGITLNAISLNRSLTMSVSGIGDVGTSSSNMSGAPLATALGLFLSISFNTDGSLTDYPSVSNFSGGTLTAPGTLGIVSGSGSDTYSLMITSNDAYQYTTIAGLSSTSWGGTSDYAGIGSVTYDYTAVPEPTTMALFICAGMLGVALMRSLRRHL